MNPLMNAVATVVGPMDYLPGGVVCFAIVLLHCLALSAAYSKASWPKSHGYRVVLFILGLVLFLGLYAIIGSDQSKRESRLFSTASKETNLLSNAIYSYSLEHDHQFPEGSNRDVMRALMDREKLPTLIHQKLILSLNSKGEVLDPWGTPYQFHLIADKDIGVISAGPDKDFGTSDDIPKRDKE